MPYVDSYIWKLRQKVGHQLLILPATDIVAVDGQDRVLLVYNKDQDRWIFPGGYVEENQTTRQSAVRELSEEGGISSDAVDFIPFASISGFTIRYSNGDITQPHSQAFLVRKWKDNGDAIDSTEIAEREWYTIDELQAMELHQNVRNILDAYLLYRETGKYQVLEEQIDN